MANQIPLSGATSTSGGVLLPPEQGEILVNGILVETGAIQIAGDARSTAARKTKFPIWQGRPTAGPVGEGARKPVTGASFGETSLNIKKFASIVIFTDEQIEDLQNGDLNVLVDAGVRQALSVATDADAVGLSAGSVLEKGQAQATGGSVFDTPLLQNASCGIQIGVAGQTIEENTKETEIQKAVSAALGVLEENGYGNPANIGVLLGFGFQRALRDARDGFKRPLYDGGTFAGQAIDALYGLDRAHSTNFVNLSAPPLTVKVKTKTASPNLTVEARGTAPLFVGQPITGAGIPAGTVIKSLTGLTLEETVIELGKLKEGTSNEYVAVNATAEASINAVVSRPVGVVVHRPNIHVRIRKDVSVAVSNEASIENEGVRYDLFQEDLTAIRYELRLGFMVHDATRAIVPLYA
jgi:hypothetical protein